MTPDAPGDPTDRAKPETVRGPAFLAGLATWVAIVFVILHLYAAMFGAPATLFFRPVHLLLALALVFVWFPLGRAPTAPFNVWSVVDLLCIGATL